MKRRVLLDKSPRFAYTGRVKGEEGKQYPSPSASESGRFGARPRGGRAKWSPSRGAERSVSPAVPRVKGVERPAKGNSGGNTDKLFAPGHMARGAFCWEGRFLYYQFKLNGYSYEDLLVLCRVTAGCYRRARTVIYRAIVLALGVVMLGLGGLLILGNFLSGDGFSLLGAALILLGLLYLGLSIFYHRFSAWRSSRMQLKDTGEITVTLDDAGVREQGRKGEGFYPYASFIGCFHSRGRYFLFLDKKHAVILPEAAMAVGDPAGLGARLAEKFGGPIPEV